jgi:oxygen-independent coproporphyrinogen III oxidase
MVFAMDEPLGVYIHIPFCAARCAYCHFVIDLARGEVQQRYVDALVREIEYWSLTLAGESPATIDSVYIGGGTPSWIPPQLIGKILRTLRAGFDEDGPSEITIEVNPDSLNEEKIALYLEAGINRFSVGVQAFHDEELKRLGRTHSMDDTERALGQLRSQGVDNISIDLMAALPGQTADEWKQNFIHIERWRPEHISLYLFDVDDDSPLGRKVIHRQQESPGVSPTPPGERSPQHRFLLPDEDEIVKIYGMALSELDRLGYEHYEISNFARRNRGGRSWRSQHNLKYWNLQPYLGLGCAAHSFVSPRRWHNDNSTAAYIHCLSHGVDVRRSIEEIDPSRLAEDAFIFGLRQIGGICYEDISCRLGHDARHLFRSVIDPLISDGWLIEETEHLRLAASSLLVSNEIFQQFLGAMP